VQCDGKASSGAHERSSTPLRPEVSTMQPRLWVEQDPNACRPSADDFQTTNQEGLGNQSAADVQDESLG